MHKRKILVGDLLSFWGPKSGIKERDFDRLRVESNPVLKEVFNLIRTIPVVVDVKRMTQRYVGLDPKNWWGWSLDEMFGEGVESYVNLIHSEDLIIHQQANHLLMKTLADCSCEEKHQLRILLNFRLRKSNGAYVQISQLTQILELDAEGNMHTLLVLLQEINHAGKAPKSYIRFWGVPRHERLYEFQSGSQEMKEFGRPTKREEEIISLLITGQDSQQIANELFISKHTIDTHRRRILQKFHLRNTHELTQLVSLTRLLDHC